MTPKKSNRGGFREENLKSFRLENFKIRGVKVFAGTFGYSLAFIKAVQATPAGALAFVDNEIYLLKFIRAANALLGTANELPEGFATWKEFREMNEARISEVNRKEKQKLLMPRAEAKTKNGEAWAFVFGEIDRACNEWPPEHAGRTAIELFARYTKWREEFRSAGKEKFEKAA